MHGLALCNCLSNFLLQKQLAQSLNSYAALVAEHNTKFAQHARLFLKDTCALQQTSPRWSETATSDAFFVSLTDSFPGHSTVANRSAAHEHESAAVFAARGTELEALEASCAIAARNLSAAVLDLHMQRDAVFLDLRVRQNELRRRFERINHALGFDAEMEDESRAAAGTTTKSATTTDAAKDASWPRWRDCAPLWEASDLSTSDVDVSD